MVGEVYQSRYEYLDKIEAEERMREGDMQHQDAVEALLEEFDIGYSVAKNTAYSYRKERGLID
jgi:hypothetical protein